MFHFECLTLNLYMLSYMACTNFTGNVAN